MMDNMRPKERWERRDKKHARRRHGMRVDGRGILLLEEIVRKKAQRARKERE